MSNVTQQIAQQTDSTGTMTSTLASDVIQQTEWQPIIIYLLAIVIVISLILLIRWKIKDKLPKKIQEIPVLFIVSTYIGIFGNSLIVKPLTGQEYASLIADYFSVCALVFGIINLLLSYSFDAFAEKLEKNTIKPLKEKIDNFEEKQETAIREFKNEHIKVYNIKQLEAFTKDDPIFRHEIVKQEAYLHIASLMKDFEIVLGGKLLLRSYDQFLNILNLLLSSGIAEGTYSITIIDHIDVENIPTTVSEGYLQIERYTESLHKLIDLTVKAGGSCKRIVVVNNEAELKDEKLLFLLFSQLNKNYNVYLIAHNSSQRTNIPIEYIRDRTRILITKNNCHCGGSELPDCAYCYSINFASPYNTKALNEDLERDLNVLKNAPGTRYLYKNYLKIFHNDNLLEELSNPEKLNSLDKDQKLFDQITAAADHTANSEIEVKTIFGDNQKSSYYLYKSVKEKWDENLSSKPSSNVYSCETNILNNEIESWLNRPFYQYVLKQNKALAESLMTVDCNFSRIFIIDKVRKSKKRTFMKILDIHLKAKIKISIVPVKRLIEKGVSFIYDYNYIEGQTIFEIAGLRRSLETKLNHKSGTNEQEYRLIVDDKAPANPCWKPYRKDGEHKEIYEAIEKFHAILMSEIIEVTKDNIHALFSNEDKPEDKKYISNELSWTDQENKLGI